MHRFRVEDKLEEILFKLSKKDSLTHERVMKKIKEIINSYDIESYKNLKYGMKDYKRIHVGHFVLIFRFDKENNLVVFEDFDHHDKIYEK